MNRILILTLMIHCTFFASERPYIFGKITFNKQEVQRLAELRIKYHIELQGIHEAKVSDTLVSILQCPLFKDIHRVKVFDKIYEKHFLKGGKSEPNTTVWIANIARTIRPRE